jgi:hypothetical protein
VIPDPKRLPGVETLSQYEAVRLSIERARAAKADAPELSPFFRRLAFPTHFGELGKWEGLSLTSSDDWLRTSLLCR